MTRNEVQRSSLLLEIGTEEIQVEADKINVSTMEIMLSK